MKKTFIFLFSVICFSFFAQPTIPVSIINISPENLCAGDSVNVCFTLDQPVSPSTPFRIFVSFTKDASQPPFPYPVFSGVLSDLGAIDTVMTKKEYCVKVATPDTLSAGQWCIYGNTQINQVYCIMVENCIQTGIQVIELSAPIIGEIFYRNMLGQTVNPTGMELLIQYCEGFRPKKVMIQ